MSADVRAALRRVRDVPGLTTLPPWATLATLRFVDPMLTRRLRVDGSDGNPVAYVVRTRLQQRFRATTADGTLLCRGHKPAISKYFDLRDADRESLGTLEVTGKRTATVAVPDGREFRLRQRWFGNGWALYDDTDAVALWSVRTATAWLTIEEQESGRRNHHTHQLGGHGFTGEFLPRDDWLVTPVATFSLAQVVAVVEAHRTQVRAARNHE